MSASSWDQVVDASETAFELVWEANNKFLELGKLNPKSVVLDIGCGTGALTRRAAARLTATGRAIGVDASGAMIARAQERHGQVANVRFHHHDAHALKFKGGACDVVYCRMSLPFFDEPTTVLARCFEALKPGGRIVLMGVGEREQNEFFGAAEPAVGEALGDVFELGRKSKLISLLQGAGFDAVKARYIRGLAHVADVQAYWGVVRGTLGLAQASVPDAVAAHVRRSPQLSLEILLALAERPDPSARPRAQVRNFEAMVAQARRRIRELSPHEVQRTLGKNVLFIDVREVEEQEQGTIRGSLTIPRGDLERRISQAVPDPTSSVVVFCQNGRRGALAAARLVQMGYRSIWNLHGGFESWKAYRMPGG